MRTRHVRAGLALAVALLTASALAGCTTSTPDPAPTPHYSIKPVVMPANLEVGAASFSACLPAKVRHTVIGFTVHNADHRDVTVNSFEYANAVGGTLDDAMVLAAMGDDHLYDGEFDSVAQVRKAFPGLSWTLASHLGSGGSFTVGSNASVYLVVSLSRVQKIATFQDPRLGYSMNGKRFFSTAPTVGIEFGSQQLCKS